MTRWSYHDLPEKVRALKTAPDAATVGEAVAWRHPDEVPEVVPGGNAYFWVAVRRKHDGRVYSFPAQYLNAMLLSNEWSDDTERSGNRYHHGPTCEVEGSFPATGWHDAKEHGEYDCVYQPLLGDADELVAWREVADYPATTPQAAQVQQEAEKYEGDTLVKLSRLLAHMCDTSTFQPPNDYNLGFAAGCEMVRRTTHPAAGDKVRELVAKWRREADRLRAINAEMDPDGKTFRYAECLREENAAQAGALTSCARALEAALQHRGDSRGGEG